MHIGSERLMNTQPSASVPVSATPVQVLPKPDGAEIPSATPVRVAAALLSQAQQQAAATSPPTRQLTSDELRRATEQLQHRMQLIAPDLQFTLDKESGRTVIKVTDQATNELIRQIPTEEVLRINKELDRFQGLLLNRKA